MTTMTERIAVDDITAEMRQVSTGKAILTVIAAVFYAIGYAAGRVVPLLMWCVFAVRKGYRSAHGPSKAMQIEALKAENNGLRTELGRFTITG